MTTEVIDKEFTVLEPEDVIKGYINLTNADIKEPKELAKMETIDLLDYQTSLTRKVCDKTCGVHDYLRDLREHNKTQPDKSIVSSEKYKFCMESCPVGKQFRVIGAIYEAKGRKRPVRESMTEGRKQYIAKSTEAMIKHDITLRLPKSRGR